MFWEYVAGFIGFALLAFNLWAWYVVFFEARVFHDKQDEQDKEHGL